MNIMKHLGFSKKDENSAAPVEKTAAGAPAMTGKGFAEEKRPSGKKSGLHFTDSYPRAEGESRIFNLIILDESGSMSAIREQAFSGANETIQSIRKAQEENPDDHQMLSFVTFDSGSRRPDVRILIDCRRIEEVDDVALEQYTPYGDTPLFDAMGLSFTALKDVVKEGDHVLVTVITDGWENSSRIYSREMVKELVDSLSSCGWTFTYIGANQDSGRIAFDLGIRSAMDFETTASGTEVMWNRMESSRNEYYKKVRHSKAAGFDMSFDEDFFADKGAAGRVTPERIDRLKAGQVFVFGSNEAGYHDGGAARAAVERFGAVYGQGRGLQGSSYAIPTMGRSIEQIGRDVLEFIEFADSHPELTFLVTRVGCGSAGFRDEDIAPLFARAYSLPNVHLPASFWKILTYRWM